ncbi:unnamed protein product [Camellia sinensis]
MFISTWLLILPFKFLWPPPNASSLSPTHQAPVSEYSNPVALPNQQIVDYPSFKFVIVGDVGTGKTTIVKRHLIGEFEKYEQHLLLSKFTLWTSSQTVGKSNFIAGILLGKRNSVVLEMVTRYYSRTGICKFGASCKFHHPRNGGGSMSNTRVNIYGYPLRPGERECSYYLKTGQCKFGVTCKFNHPQLGGMSMPEPAHQFYPTVQSSSSVPSFDLYGAVSPSYRTGRPPPLPGSYVPSAYQVLMVLCFFLLVLFPFRVGVLTRGPVSPVLSPSVPYSVGAGSPYGVTQLPSSASAFARPYPTFPSPAGPSSSTQERRFPERPGQPDCQYYLKTGDCKFGSSCRFHYPPDWVVSKTNCLLSPMGLPMCPMARLQTQQKREKKIFV